MPITIREFNTDERNDYEEEQYKKFMELYKKTNKTVGEIMIEMNINNRNYIAKYIRSRLKKEGYNSSERYGKIRRGEWL